ncbi:hypothetical protein EDB86DRAFT_2828255 [Lactarius hatsudake]|nr:hypothetical protein EDB86DRAFT_2828255 [Lactarius hatsudake]
MTEMHASHCHAAGTSWASVQCIKIQPIFSSPAATAPESFKPPTSPTHAKASPCFPTLQAPSTASALSPWPSPHPPLAACRSTYPHPVTACKSCYDAARKTNHDTNPPRAGPCPGHTPTNQKAHTATLHAMSTTACQGPIHGWRGDIATMAATMVRRHRHDGGDDATTVRRYHHNGGGGDGNDDGNNDNDGGTTTAMEAR